MVLLRRLFLLMFVSAFLFNCSNDSSVSPDDNNGNVNGNGNGNVNGDGNGNGNFVAPTFMTGSIIEIPAPLLGEDALSLDEVADSKNHYLNSFGRISNIIRILNGGKTALEDYLENSKTNFEYYEKNIKDTTVTLLSTSGKLESIVTALTIDTKSKYKEIVLDNATKDTVSVVEYCANDFGFVGNASYKFEESEYKIEFNQINGTTKTTTVYANYNSSYLDISSIKMFLKQDGDFVTVSTKIVLPKSSSVLVESYDLTDEIMLVTSAVDIKNNVAQVFASSYKSNLEQTDKPFVNHSFVDKIMVNEYYRYDKFLSEELDFRKQVIASVINSVKLEDLTKDVVDKIEDDAEFTIENFKTYLSLNKENEDAGTKAMFDYSKIEFPIYFDENAKYFADKNTVDSKYSTLSADTISVLK